MVMEAVVEAAQCFSSGISTKSSLGAADADINCHKIFNRGQMFSGQDAFPVAKFPHTAFHLYDRTVEIDGCIYVYGCIRKGAVDTHTPTNIYR